MAAARPLLRSSASFLVRAAPPARARSSSSSLGVGASRPSIRPALAAPPRPVLRLPVEASFCLESLQPMHNSMTAARLKSMLAVPGTQLVGWLTEDSLHGRGNGRHGSVCDYSSHRYPKTILLHLGKGSHDGRRQVTAPVFRFFLRAGPTISSSSLGVEVVRPSTLRVLDAPPPLVAR